VSIYIDQNGEQQYSERKELNFEEFVEALSKLPKGKDIIVAEDDGGFIHEHINYGNDNYQSAIYHGLVELCYSPYSNFTPVQPYYHSEEDVIVIAEIRSEFL
tara:strand:+ start:106 stop:411 length:306 start_codon:yes stop_codon:yes gene_type:complete